MNLRAKIFDGHDALHWLAGLAIACGLMSSYIFTWNTGNRPWFEPRLAIDGPSYARDMVALASSSDFIHLNDLYHSPGYQVYLGCIDSVCGGQSVFRYIKLLAWILAALCMAMVFRLGEFRFGRHVGAVAAVLLAFSFKWKAYINLLQYEIPLAFVLTGLAFLFSWILPRTSRPDGPLTILTGLVLAAACFLHFRFLLLVPLSAWSFWILRADGLRRSKKAACLVLFLSPPLLAVGCWSAYQTSRLGEAVVVQRIAPWSRQFRLHNHLQAQGFAYPYVESVEPSGWPFVARKPGRYLQLIVERFLYLWDFRKDIWYIGPSPSGFEYLFHLAACLLFFAGVALKLQVDLTSGLFRQNAIIYCIVSVALAGPILSTGSSRFLVPILPLVCLFQSYALVRAAAC